MDRTKGRGAMWGLLALVVAIGLMGSALAGGSALAAKGGPNATTSGGPTMTVSPNPVPLGASSIDISGSGFRANQALSINTGMIPSVSVTTDANGSFSLTYAPWGGTFWMPGDARIEATKQQGKRTVVLAIAYYTVCSTNPC